MNNRHPWQLKKSKSWGPFWSCQLNSTANSAHLAHFCGEQAELAVLSSWQLQNGPQNFDFFSIAVGAHYSFDLISIIHYHLLDIIKFSQAVLLVDCRFWFGHLWAIPKKNTPLHYGCLCALDFKFICGFLGVSPKMLGFLRKGIPADEIHPTLPVYSLQFICYYPKYIFQTYLKDSTT